jgi:hypothetical protein
MNKKEIMIKLNLSQSQVQILERLLTQAVERSEPAMSVACEMVDIYRILHKALEENK